MVQIQPYSLLESYTPAAVNDEMVTARGELYPHWRDFMAYWAHLGQDGVERLQQDVRRLLQENGVTYNVHGAPDGHQRPWPLDLVPFILAEEDWRMIEAGVIQRAELLNLILTDLYGAQTLIKAGLLPLELIYRDARFLRPCHNVLLPTDRQLIMYAADLARGPDRRMWVVGDRTQAPSGAGYALENRTILAQLQSSFFRDHKIRRLAGYFGELQATLARMAPQHQTAPRVVVMTPGPHNETYFEHAYLAAYLGYTLVQGDDLSVNHGDVSLKALSGLQPVDTILRRVDDTFCDPLELRADSWLGVAGLLESVRRGRVAVVNPLGSGVLENPGIMPFLPGIAHHLLGEDLILPMAATWWCGQPKELEYVLDHLDQLIIKLCSGRTGAQPILPSALSHKEKATLRQQIQAQPYLYVGQERVTHSTAPALVNGTLAPRHTVLRTYALASKDQYTVMPGGLTRSASASNDLVVSTSAGGASKDTWIQTAEPEHYISLWQNRADHAVEALHTTESLPSRAAENLFWVGRYAERAESTARLLRTIFDFFAGHELPTHPVEQAALQQLLVALTQVTMTYPGFVDKGAKARLKRPTGELLSVTLDANRSGALHADLKSMAHAAYAVRNLWSTDSWRVMQEIDLLWETMQQMLAKKKDFDLNLLRRDLNRLITHMMALAGLHSESMTHNAGWLLLDTGRRLERAMRSVALIRSILMVVHEPMVEQLLLEATLKTTENIITYRRRYRAHLQTRTVLDLLMHDDLNPRSLIWQFNHLREHLAHLPRTKLSHQLSQEERIILKASTQLQLANTEQLIEASDSSVVRQALDDLMAELSFQLSELSYVLTQTFFTHTQIRQQYGAVRAELNSPMNKKRA